MEGRTVKDKASNLNNKAMKGQTHDGASGVRGMCESEGEGLSLGPRESQQFNCHENTLHI